MLVCAIVPPAVLVAPVLVAVAALGEAQQPRVAGRQRDDLQSARSSETSLAGIGLDRHEYNIQMEKVDTL